MEYLIGIFWTLIEYSALILSCEAFLIREKSRVRMAIAFACLLGYCLILLYNIPVLIRQIAAISISIIVISFLYSGKWTVKVLIALLSYSVLAILDSVFLYGTAYLLRISLETLVWKKILYTTVVSVGKCVYLLLAWLLQHFYRQRRSTTNWPKWLLLMLLFPSASLIMFAVLFNLSKTEDDLNGAVLIFAISLGFANAGLMYLMNKIEKDMQTRQELALLSQQMSIQVESLHSLEKAYQAQRTASHEFRNHMHTVQMLLLDQRTAEAIAYTNRLLETHSKRVLAVRTNHAIVDAVLNQKYQRATESNIETQFQISDLSAWHLSDSAIVVLLSNLMDNAIEACLKLPKDRRIFVQLIMDDNTVLLSIKNTSPPVEIVRNRIQTTKAPAYEHGYGLPAVRKILDQTNAEYSFSYQNGWFLFSAEICYKGD